MKRTLLPLIFGIVTLGVTTFTAEAQTGRQIYGGRQPGVPRSSQPIYDDQPLVTPRMAPMLPGEQSSFPIPAQVFHSDQPQTIIMEGPVFVPPEHAVDPDPNRPLSGIDFPSLSAPKQSGATTMFPEPVKTSVPTVLPAPAEQIDEFYARLGKLQLEKKQLAETLTLIGKIKSDSFKVKTLVELAEYVAHDTNYKKEAEQLFALAQNGIDALAGGRPVSVAAPEKASPVIQVKPNVEQKTEPEEKAPPKKPAMLLDDDEPVAEEKKPATAPKKRPELILGDEPTANASKEAEQPAKAQTRRPTRRMLTDDE